MAVPGLRFGACEIRPATRELLRNGKIEDVQPRAFDLLVYLIENPDRVVSKDELLDHVWGRRIVSESVVARTVMKARKAIGDDASEPRFIVTQHGHGYRFVAELLPALPPAIDKAAPAPDLQSASGPQPRVDVVPARTPPDRGNASTRPHRLHLRSVPRRFWVPMVVVVALVGVIMLLPSERAKSSVTPRMAVLPVVDATHRESLDWARLGLMSMIGESIDQASRVDLVPVDELLGAMATIEAGTAGAGALTSGDRTALNELLATRLLVEGRLRNSGGRFHLDISVFQGEQRKDMTFSGMEPAELATQAGKGIAKLIEAPLHADNADVRMSADPYINETYARALDAMARARFDDAAKLLAIVVDAGGGQLEPKLKLSQALQRAGHHEQALTVARELKPLAVERQDKETLAAIYYVMSDALHQLGDLDGAKAKAREALALASPDNPEIAPDAKLQLGKLAYERSQYEQARTLTEAAIAGYQRMDSEYRLAEGYLRLGMIAQRVDVATAPFYHRRTLELARRTGRPRIELRALIFLADATRTLGDCQQALAYLDRALLLARQTENRHDQARAHVVKGRCEKALGNIDASIDEMRAAMELAKALDEPGLLALTMLNYANALAQQPDSTLSQTEQIYRRAAELYQQHGQSGDAAGTLLNLAQQMIGVGRYDDAAELLATSERLARTTDDVVLVAGSLALHAKAAYRQGQLDQAAELMQQARSVSEPNSRPWAEAAAALIWVHLDQGKIDKAKALSVSTVAIRSGYVSLCIAGARLLYEQSMFQEALAKQEACMAKLGDRVAPVDRAIQRAYAQALASGERVPMPDATPPMLWL